VGAEEQEGGGRLAAVAAVIKLELAGGDLPRAEQLAGGCGSGSAGRRRQARAEAPEATRLAVILPDGRTPPLHRSPATDAAGCATDLSISSHFLPASSPMLTRAQIPARSSAGGGSGRAAAAR
jgi:hypothetical protein